MRAKLLLTLGPVLALCAVLTPSVRSGGGNQAEDIRELKLKDWQPKSMMVTKTTVVEKPLFPVIDIHNHLGSGKQRLTEATVKRYLTEMDAAGVKTAANLDGRWGDTLKETIAALDQAH